MSEVDRSIEWANPETEYWLAVSALGRVQDLLMDEDPEVDRLDLEEYTWAELQQPVAEYEDSSRQAHRQVAYNHIHALYMESLETLYPSLRNVTTAEEMRVEMAKIPNLPACDGQFSCSRYRAENGNARSVSYTVVNVGGRTALSMIIADCEDHIMKSYNIRTDVDGAIWGSSRLDLVGNDDEEREMIAKVHPSQESNLRRVMYASVAPYDLELKLAEIRMMSQDMTDEQELDRVIAYARARYAQSQKETAQDAESGMMGLTVVELRDINTILDERNEQLTTGS